MLNFKKIVICIVFFFGLLIHAQENQQYNPYVEKLLFSYESDKALGYIDSLLLKNVDTTKHISLKVQKVQVLIQAELYKEALKLANKLLENKNLTQNQKTRTLIKRSLLYEIFGEFEKATSDLESVKNSYNSTNKKDELYGNYLYRKSSLNRVQGKNSLYILYAKKANDFGEKHQYLDVIANSNMLLSFNKNNKNVKALENYTQKALQIWKKAGDTHGAVAMYFRMARFYKQKNNAMVLVYLDSAIHISEKTNHQFLMPEVFREKSEVYQQKNDTKKALKFYKKYKEFTDKAQEKNQLIKIKEIEFSKDVETATLNNKLLKTKLSQTASEKKVLVISVVVLAIILSILAFIQHILRAKNKKIKAQEAEIRATNKELEKNINYKNFLLKEIHHRVKNKLALIISLVRFQKNTVETDKTRRKFQTLEDRIKTIALAHEKFFPKLEKEEENTFKLNSYINTIVNSLVNLADKEITVHQNITDTKTTLDTALPIGIIINELIANSIKHANVSILELKISITIKNKEVFITYADNGTSFKNNNKKNSLGLTIINNMVQQLEGTMQRKQSQYDIRLQLKE